jgi:tripartite-type tricarboxylate transporter receptor subunit TctC
MKRRHLLVTAASALPLLHAPQALAQSDKPIKLIVGFPPGGSIDTVARTIAEKMRVDLNQPVVIENKTGAGGRLAAELLKNAPADGTTLMITPVVVPVLAPLVFSKLPYNPITDFTPVGHVVNFNFGLAVKGDSPIKTVPEFVAWLKANPQKASFGSPAAGSLPHFFGLLLAREAKVDMVHISYNGGAPLQTAVLGDQVPAGIDVVFEFLQNHRAGKARIIATSGRARAKVLPDVPTFAEQGFPNIVGQGWFGLYAPPKTAAAEVERVNKALNKALASPDVIEKFLSLGLETGGGSVADLVRIMETDTNRWGPIVKASGFKAD